MLKKAGIEIEYVAVPEKHKKGGYHLHVAIKGRVNINIMNGCWWSLCGGKGMGNIDISFKKNQSQSQRLQGVAKYVSKYVTKQKGVVDFNKKRYWSTKTGGEKITRMILSADSYEDALKEISRNFGYKENVIKEQGYQFPNEGGIWFESDESIYDNPPF